MKYLSRTEYSRLYGISRQAVADRIRRGTLPIVKIRELVERIPIDDSEYDRVKADHLTL